jgi:hypothetical protein
MLFMEEEDGGSVQTEPQRIAAPAVPADSRRRSARVSSSAPVFHPLAYRRVVGGWPVEWREQWGRRANALEENGLSWRDAETQAFVEVWKLRRQEHAEQPSASMLVATSALSN